MNQATKQAETLRARICVVQCNKRFRIRITRKILTSWWKRISIYCRCNGLIFVFAKKQRKRFSVTEGCHSKAENWKFERSWKKKVSFSHLYQLKNRKKLSTNKQGKVFTNLHTFLFHVPFVKMSLGLLKCCRCCVLRRKKRSFFICSIWKFVY